MDLDWRVIQGRNVLLQVSVVESGYGELELIFWIDADASAFFFPLVVVESQVTVDIPHIYLLFLFQAHLLVFYFLGLSMNFARVDFLERPYLLPLFIIIVQVVQEGERLLQVQVLQIILHGLRKQDAVIRVLLLRNVQQRNVVLYLLLELKFGVLLPLSVYFVQVLIHFVLRIQAYPSQLYKLFF